LIVQGGKGGLIPLVKNLKARLCIEKAKPSTVAAAIPGSSPSFLAIQNGRDPKNIPSNARGTQYPVPVWSATPQRRIALKTARDRESCPRK
jgi:hypothetical protein